MMQMNLMISLLLRPTKKSWLEIFLKDFKSALESK